jgi:membrane-bound serine protease (ClpP class)
MIGAVGDVLAVESGQAWAMVHGERWKVHSLDALTTGQRVRVLALHDLSLEVCAENVDIDPTPKGNAS